MGLFGSRKNSDDNRNFHIFEEAQQQAGENVQLVLRKSDLYPIHISPNFKRVLGVEPARMVDDVETLFRFASEEDYPPSSAPSGNGTALAPLPLTPSTACPPTRSGESTCAPPFRP